MSIPPHARRLLYWLAVSLITLGACSACETTATRVAPLDTSDPSSHWNDADSRLTADDLIKDALNRPWMPRFTQLTGRAPVISVGTVLNRTHEHLNTQTFIKELQRAMVESGQVQFVADAGQRQEIRQERAEQGPNARSETVKPAAQELSADFILQGSIHSTVDDTAGRKAVTYKAVTYKIDLELIDIVSNIKVWLGHKTVKKVVERPKATL